MWFGNKDFIKGVFSKEEKQKAKRELAELQEKIERMDRE